MKNPPRLILIAGTAAVGKTVFSRNLARTLSDCVLIDKDTLNDGFWWQPTETPDDPLAPYRKEKGLRGSPEGDTYYARHVRVQSYHTMIELAKDNLGVGKHVIVDGNYQNELRISYIEKILQPALVEIEYILKILHCRAPEHIVRERMTQRRFARDDLTPKFQTLTRRDYPLESSVYEETPRRSGSERANYQPH